MRCRSLLCITLTGATCLPLLGQVQDLLGDDEKVALEPPAQLGGRLAVDLMPGYRPGLGYPLRYAGIIKGSVKADVDGVPLEEGRDFTLDYAAGVMYIARRVKAEQSIRVAYRHDPKYAHQSMQSSALPILSLSFGQSSSVQMLLGVTGVSRNSDGSMMNSNLAGMRNNFSFSGGSLAGLFLVSNQSEAMVDADSSSPDQTAPKDGVTGTDRLIVQDFSAKFGSVSFNLNYQDVGEKFSGFSMLQAAGYDQITAAQLEKEKGLQRIGLGISAGDPSSLQLSNSMKVVSDGDATIEWGGYDIKAGAFGAYYNYRSIDQGFNRFRDLAEKDRDQLAKERGIDRMGVGGSYRFNPTTSLKYDQSTIGDRNGDISFRSFNFGSSFVNVSFLEQIFDQKFTRTKDLAEGERELWAKQRGLERREFLLSTPKDAKGLQLSYFTREVEQGKNRLSANAFSFAHGGYGIEFWNRSIDRGFGRTGDLPQADLDQMIAQTARMYDPKANPNQNDRGMLAREAGIDREFLRLTANPLKNWGMAFEQIGIVSGKNGIGRTAFQISTPSVKFDFSNMNFSAGFNRVGDLSDYERKLYGNQIGFDRTDWSFAGNFGKLGALTVSNLTVNSAEGSADRLTAKYASNGIEIAGSMRSVDDTFRRAGSIVDPEASLLGSLAGFNQRDLAFKLTSVKNLSVEGLLYGSENPSLRQSRDRQRLDVKYSIDAKTGVRLLADRAHFDGADGALLHNDFFLGEAQRDLGSLGKVTFRHETEEVFGSEAKRPGRQTNYLKYDTNLSKTIGVGTEQARTEFADGGYENLQIYRATAKLTPKLTVTASDISIDRDGNKPDLNTYSYGIAYDFGNNLKIGYNHFRELNSAGVGRRDLRWDVSSGDYYGVDIGGSYDEKRIDNERTTTLAKFNISNKKPFNIGPLSNISIKLGFDGQSDRAIIQRENKLGDFTARLFGSDIGATYSHVILPGEHVAADRTFWLKLDPSGKNPLQANLQYKVRTLPNDDNHVIRNYDISWKPNDTFKLSHKAETLPERANGGVPLGSNLLPTGTRSWAIDWNSSKTTAYKFAFSELFNWQQNTLARKLEFGVSLFKDSGSPLTLKYGIENLEAVRDRRSTRSVFEVSFDQKPGPNQVLSMSVGTINWEQGVPQGTLANNVTFRVDYQLRF